MRTVLKGNPCLGSPSLFSAATLLATPETLTAYDDRVAFAVMKPYLSAETKVLDLGCGPESGLPLALCQNCHSYNGVDLEPYFIDQLHDSLNLCSVENFHLGIYDLRDGLGPLEDNSYEIVLMKSSLMHIPANLRTTLIQEARRVASKAVFIVEISWSRLGNPIYDQVFRDFRSAAAKLLEYHGKEPYMDRHLPELLVQALPGKSSEYFRLDDDCWSEELAHALLCNCHGGNRCLAQCYEGPDAQFIRHSFEEMEWYLNGDNPVFTPPACIVAHIPKT